MLDMAVGSEGVEGQLLCAHGPPRHIGSTIATTVMVSDLLQCAGVDLDSQVPGDMQARTYRQRGLVLVVRFEYSNSKRHWFGTNEVLASSIPSGPGQKKKKLCLLLEACARAECAPVPLCPCSQTQHMGAASAYLLLSADAASPVHLNRLSLR